MSRISSFALASFFTLLIANAQTPVTTPATPGLTSLSLEAVVPVDSIDATITPNIPSDVLALLTSGANELRQQLVYNASTKTLKVTGITEAAGSPLPTPADAAGVTTLWTYTVNVDRVDISAKKNAFAFLGTISTDSATTTPFGDISGSLVSISAGYTAATDATTATTFSGISTDVAGAASLFSKKGTGSVAFGDTGTSNGLPVAVAGPKNFISGTTQFQLDGTKSNDPSGGTLTYHWTFMPFNGNSASIANADTATPTVTVPDFSLADGDYAFQLTVTNSAGLSATDTVTVTYSAGYTPQ